MFRSRFHGMNCRVLALRPRAPDVSASKYGALVLKGISNPRLKRIGQIVGFYGYPYIYTTGPSDIYQYLNLFFLFLFSHSHILTWLRSPLRLIRPSMATFLRNGLASWPLSCLLYPLVRIFSMLLRGDSNTFPHSRSLDSSPLWSSDPV